MTTDPAKLGNVTLNVLDYFTGGVDNTWMNDVVAAFEKKYPNITVKRQSITWSDLMQELPLKLKSPNPPDIVPPNNGWQSLGTLVQGGLVDNLDSYATAYGWDKNVPGSILREQEFSANGTADGHRHPVRHAGRALVGDRGLLQPLAAAALRAERADHVQRLRQRPRQGEAGRHHPDRARQPGAGRHHPAAVQRDGRARRPVDIANYIYSLGQGSLESQASGFPQAVAAMSDWATKGYFTSQFAGLPETDAETQFVQGKALFHFDYSGSLPFTSGAGRSFGSSSCRATTASRRSRPCRRRPNSACLAVQARRRRGRVPELRRQPGRGTSGHIGPTRCSIRACKPPARPPFADESTTPTW